MGDYIQWVVNNFNDYDLRLDEFEYFLEKNYGQEEVADFLLMDAFRSFSANQIYENIMCYGFYQCCLRIGMIKNPNNKKQYIVEDSNKDIQENDLYLYFQYKIEQLKRSIDCQVPLANYKFCYAYCLHYGIGMIKDEEKSFELLLDSALKGNPYAQFLAACKYYSQKNYEFFLYFMEEAAQGGYTYAMFILAQCNCSILSRNEFRRIECDSNFVPNDKTMAYYLKMASDRGEMHASCILAMLYISGYIVKKDVKKGLGMLLPSTYWEVKHNAYIGYSDNIRMLYDFVMKRK